jgi:glycosyltransferase involved in cell wall biosynthesis
LNQLWYWKNVFRRLSVDQGAQSPFRVDGRYIVQVARFDPSKGYPDVLEVYRRYSELVQEVPQLVLCGHGSIDDPDGTLVFEALVELLGSKPFTDIASMVCIVRVPACDQILNAILSDAWVALQLSYREGFEVKVTEASLKGVPVIAYRAGGIPCQIIHGHTGFVEAVGDVDAVVTRLIQLDDTELYTKMSTAARTNASLTSFSTIQNLGRWLSLGLIKVAQQCICACMSLATKCLPCIVWIHTSTKC